ncbi:class II aldolase/adducin domain protein [Mycena olivaceomarginata]|nr:class II aldolase/adducin domain protein [Mycena olivaceomarginata]
MRLVYGPTALASCPSNCSREKHEAPPRESRPDMGSSWITDFMHPKEPGFNWIRDRVGGRAFSGHITVRDPIRPDCFWVNPFPSALLLVNHQGEIFEESGQKDGPFRILNTAAFMIHSAIHSARPDVTCAAHSHSTHGKAFSALGRKLDPMNQDVCAFYNDHVLYKQYNDIVLDEVEGKAITEALGSKKAAILQNHGLLVATSSIEATLHFYITLERSCGVQLWVHAAATASGVKTAPADSADAVETAKALGPQDTAWLKGNM